jgi:hypothetical protein
MNNYLCSLTSDVLIAICNRLIVSMLFMFARQNFYSFLQCLHGKDCKILINQNRDNKRVFCQKSDYFIALLVA